MIGKVIKENGRWYAWCERHKCARNAFSDEGCAVLDIMFPEIKELPK